MADEILPGSPMRTELQDIPIVPKGGNVVRVHPRATQNVKLLPLLDLIARQAIDNIECETNNLGSAVVPEDAANTQVFKDTLIRMWQRILKWNRGGPAVKFEWTHVIRFPSEVEIQEMPSTPIRQLNYQLFVLFNTVLSTQGASAQAFVDGGGIDQIQQAIDEVTDFIDVEIGTGAPTSGGKFDTGAGMPETVAIGIVSPTPIQGEATTAEPTSAPPPAMPPDTPDVPSA